MYCWIKPSKQTGLLSADIATIDLLLSTFRLSKTERGITKEDHDFVQQLLQHHDELYRETAQLKSLISVLQSLETENAAKGNAESVLPEPEVPCIAGLILACFRCASLNSMFIKFRFILLLFSIASCKLLKSVLKGIRKIL